AGCEEFAVALGCHLLSAPPPPLQVLREAAVKKMFCRGPFCSVELGRSAVHLLLVPGILWAAYRDVIWEWPLPPPAPVAQGPGREGPDLDPGGPAPSGTAGVQVRNAAGMPAVVRAPREPDAPARSGRPGPG